MTIAKIKHNWKLRLPKVKDTSSERREFRRRLNRRFNRSLQFKSKGQIRVRYSLIIDDRMKDDIR